MRHMIKKLLDAIRSDDHQVVKDLLENTFTIDDLKKEKQNILCSAAVFGKIQSVKLLLDMGYDANRIDDLTLAPPLVLAASQGYCDIIKLLLSHQADPNIADCDKVTALHLACKRGDIEIVELLLRHKANPNVENRYAATPLSHALFGSHQNLNHEIEITKLLFQYGADVNYQDRHGLTVAMQATFFKNIPFLDYYINQQNADLSLKNNKQETVFDLAQKNKTRDVENFLRNTVVFPRIQKSFHQNKHALTQKKRRSSLKLKRRF